jgi:H/ACA ribonucleoprotein complex subunit 3
MTMTTLIRKCAACNLYTAKGFCPKCNEKTSMTAPPKFSPEDKYGGIRRAEMAEEGTQ